MCLPERDTDRWQPEDRYLLVYTILEQLQTHKYQYWILDTEGVYSTCPDAVSLGSAQKAPEIEEVLNTRAKPDISVSVVLCSMTETLRRVFVLQLFSLLRTKGKTYTVGPIAL